MMQGKSAFALMIALTLLSSCERPTRDPVKLAAIKTESEILMKAQTGKNDEFVPNPAWPRGIASLKPDSVSIDADGVHITVKPYFDGGWGYFVPREEQQLPEPVGRFNEAGQGVYWWHPY